MPMQLPGTVSIIQAAAKSCQGTCYRDKFGLHLVAWSVEEDTHGETTDESGNRL